ncbi:secreted phosphoprotein 24-like isoform X3 [Leucoraja erinacea]|uniref:secreted phosphoprotein 24-like isoform X3 n=1 Tax=Leucoraja erinaceus TaxID=7782 RepID=UPI002455ED5A|nr:secreted phosphoprotein 24-like isoform X3 [Leucoraja erinacea]
MEPTFHLIPVPTTNMLSKHESVFECGGGAGYKDRRQRGEGRSRERSSNFTLRTQPADPTQDRMKSFLLVIAAVQILHCSGVPSTKDALRASVAKLNEITEITNLCAITRRGVTTTYRTGKLSYNVDLTFAVKETVCSKNSGQEFYDPSCTFLSRNIAEKGFCKSRVEYFADKVADVDVECEGLKTIDSESDSTESNETSIEAQSKSNETSLEKTSSVSIN